MWEFLFIKFKKDLYTIVVRTSFGLIQKAILTEIFNIEPTTATNKNTRNATINIKFRDLCFICIKNNMRRPGLSLIEVISNPDKRLGRPRSFMAIDAISEIVAIRPPAQ